MSRDLFPSQVFLLRLVYAVLPTLLICGILWYAVLGEQGILRYHMLKQSLNIVRSETTAVESYNQNIRNQITRYSQSPRLIQFQAAERLQQAGDEVTIYRFNE